MLDKFTADGSHVYVGPAQPERALLLVDRLESDQVGVALLSAAEATEIAFALLGWATADERVESPSLRVAVRSSIERTARLIGQAQQR